MSEGFLARWSKRKRDGERPPAADPAPTEPAPAAVPAEGDLPAEELLKLPRLEDITAQTDIAAFLQRGVPLALRNAALRRIWTLDPAIRDFVNDAREYAYDWNVPGGAPGFGPLSTQDVEAAARAFFESVDPARNLPTGMSDNGPRDGTEPSEAPPPVDAAQHEDPTTHDADACAEGTAPAIAADAPLPHHRLASDQGGNSAAVQHDLDESRVPVAPRRRHGGAAPV